MEETLIELFRSAPYLVSLLAGMLTFVSPCVLPLIPAYLSYISGLSLQQLSGEEKMTLKARLKIVQASLMFILGFSVVFVALGASMAELIGDFFAYQWVNWVAGGIIIVFGLHFMGVINIRFLNLQRQARFGDCACFFAPFLLGLSFALGWTPCIGPIFASIISIAAQGDSSTQGLTLMSVYALGLGIPFFLAAVLTTWMLGFMNRIKKYFRIIEMGAGVLLIFIGVMVATGGF